MSENIRHPGTEINDAALEGVSGGMSGAEKKAKAKAIAKNTCLHCRTDGQGCRAGDEREQLLADWLCKHDFYVKNDCFWYNMCPYAWEPFVR